MPKIKTILDVRRQVMQEKFDRVNTKVFVQLPTGEAAPVIGIELDSEPNGAGKLAVFIIAGEAVTENANG